MSYHTKTSEFRKGDRVEIHPALDAWMMGKRFGEVTRVAKLTLWVKMDKGGTLKLRPADIFWLMSSKPIR